MGNWAKTLWDTLISLSLIVIIVALIVEFFFHPDEHTLELIHTLDIIALSFLFVELAYDFHKAEDKKKFVTREWLLIISFLPFGTILRISRVLKSSRLVVFFSMVWVRIAKLLRIERAGVKTAQSLVHATKITRAIRPAAQFLSKREKQLEKVRKRY